MLWWFCSALALIPSSSLQHLQKFSRSDGSTFLIICNRISVGSLNSGDIVGRSLRQRDSVNGLVSYAFLFSGYDADRHIPSCDSQSKLIGSSSCCASDIQQRVICDDQHMEVVCYSVPESEVRTVKEPGMQHNRRESFMCGGRCCCPRLTPFGDRNREAYNTKGLCPATQRQRLVFQSWYILTSRASQQVVYSLMGVLNIR